MTAMWNAAQCTYPTSTPSATLTSTGTITPTPSPTVSETPAGTFTATPTFSDSPTESPTFSVSPTFTVSPTLTATPSVSPSPSVTATLAPQGGPVGVDSVVGAPNPNPHSLKVHLTGPADKVRLRLYSEAYVLVGTYESGPMLAGWNSLPFAVVAVGLHNGLYFALVDASRGGEKGGKMGRTTIYWAK